MPWLNVYLGILLFDRSSRQKIFLKLDALIATKPVTLLNIVVIGKNPISLQISLDITLTSTKNDLQVVLTYHLMGN